jgi:hypothetical protein
MAQKMMHIACPNCRSPLQANIEQIVDVSKDPGGKARLLSGSLNHSKCPSCGFEGMLATPIVYHDPGHELLLTYIPVEISLPKDEQEKLIGQLINRVIESLPPEGRKAYLLQPQAVLTMQGLLERVLEADGITHEEIEAQREVMRLFEELIRLPEEHIKPFVAEHDEQLDSTFFQLATVTIQTTEDARAREALTLRMNLALENSSFGKEMIEREAELQAALESLREAGADISREVILDLLVEAPNEQRINALVSLTRPALDYTFFQLLTERSDQAEGDEKERLLDLRGDILKVTEQIDQVQQARAEQAATLLKSMIGSDDLLQAVDAALPVIDELFIGTLRANIRAAKDQGDVALLEKLQSIENHIQDRVQESLPPGIRFAQSVIMEKDEARAAEMLRENPDGIDAEFLNALLATSQQLEEQSRPEEAEAIRRLYRAALRQSMQSKLRASG